MADSEKSSEQQQPAKAEPTNNEAATPATQEDQQPKQVIGE